MVFPCTNAFIALASFDIERMVDFYTRLFEQEPHPYIVNVYAEFQLPGLRLGIFKPKDTNRQEFEHQGKDRMSLCLEISDLEVAIAHLQALGHPPIEQIFVASHGREFYAYDPDGNRLILHQTTDIKF